MRADLLDVIAFLHETSGDVWHGVMAGPVQLRAELERRLDPLRRRARDRHRAACGQVRDMVVQRLQRDDFVGGVLIRRRRASCELIGQLLLAASDELGQLFGDGIVHRRHLVLVRRFPRLRWRGWGHPFRRAPSTARSWCCRRRCCDRTLSRSSRRCARLPRKCCPTHTT